MCQSGLMSVRRSHPMAALFAVLMAALMSFMPMKGHSAVDGNTTASPQMRAGGLNTDALDAPDAVLQSEKDFAAWLKPIIEAIPGVKKVTYDAAQQEFRVKTRQKDDERRLFIGNLIQVLRNGGNKEQRREALRNYLLFLETPSLFENPEIKDVLPVLRADRLLDEIRRLKSEEKAAGNKKIELPYFREMAGVIRVFVVNAESSVAYVSLDNLDKWKLSKEKLSEIAFDNLRAYYENVPIHVEKDENFSIVIVDNFFETSVALIDTFWEKQRDENGGAPVALFLARNIVVFTHEKDERGVMLLRRYARTAEEIPYELSRDLFRWKDGRWEVFLEVKK